MEKHTVLICDDNEIIHTGLTNYLSSEGFNVISAYDGESALEMVRTRRVDVVVLDIMLPGMDGFAVCRRLRRFSEVPVIMLSARGDEMDRVVGLELGAEDYVVKPFSLRELTLRIKRTLERRTRTPEERKLSLAELTIYPDSYQVFVNGRSLELTAKEFEVLVFLVSNVDKVLTREQIIGAAWGYEYYGSARAVDNLIKRLRQKLHRETELHLEIRTVYGLGYKLEECYEKNGEP